MSLIAHTDISAYNGKTYESAQQTELTRLCGVVEKLFERMTNGRRFSDNASTEFTQELEVENKDTIDLPIRPTSITSISYLSDFGDEAYTVIDSGDYMLRGVAIKFAYTLNGYYKVVYKGETIPADVKQALIEWVMLLYGAKNTDGKQTSTEARGTSQNNYMIKENLPVFIQQVIEAQTIYHV